MYDIRQFRPILYVLVGLGFTGFAIATGSASLWLFAIGMLLLNGWLIRRGLFRPFPRWLANLLTIVAALYTASSIWAGNQPIFPIGNFLVLLQLIKLYEQRANRDYAQLLVLSLLLVVAAAISTASLLFGVVFIVYLLLSPYVCLLFHLKVETDHAKRQMGLDERQANPMTLRQDQRYLSRSMARLTALVATAAIFCGVVVFLFFPRVPGVNLLAWQFRPSMAATGMSEQMNMQSVTRVQQNTTQIASLTITRDNEPVTGGDIYLRGTVYDIYDGDPTSPGRWGWLREGQFTDPALIRMFRPGPEEALVAGQRAESDEGAWVQDIDLKPTGVKFLPAMPGAIRMSVERPIRLGYAAPDGVIQLEQDMFQRLPYRVVSMGTQPFSRSRDLRPAGGGPTPQRSIIAREIADYARRPEVSGLAADGTPLTDRLRPAAVDDADPQVSPETEEIARNIERHLQTQFTYTLDLSADRPKDDQADPVVHFLYDTKSGWCEHFAYAMTLMCQSLGMEARLVSGYKCDEFNAIGGYFIVRQSHAHAWVEVLVRDGERLVWKTFDPTSGLGADTQRATSRWQKIAHFFDFLEHTWANAVVAYDASSQSGMLDGVEARLINATARANTAVRESGGWWGRLQDWFRESRYQVSEVVIIALLTIMGLAFVGVIAGYLIQRARLTRRAKRIGLDSLGGAQARRLARHLGFYDDLTRILERRSIVRSPHLTPMEFGRSLSFLPQDAYRTILRLTQVFYRIRYGQRRLTPAQRRKLVRVIDRLHDQLSSSASAHSPPAP